MLGGTWSVAVGACRVRREVKRPVAMRYSGFLDDLVAQREGEFSDHEAVFGCRDDVLTGDVSGLSATSAVTSVSRRSS